MSDLGDYLDEMDRNRTTDTAIEGLFAGSSNPGDGLEPLADIFVALRTDLDNELADETVGRIVALAAAAAGSTSTNAPAAHRPRSRFLLSSLRRRAATVAVAATVFLGGTSGLAVAANGAMPGDALYGVDRALEAVGIGAGGQQERLVEADALIASGDVVAGLQHAAEVFGESDGSTTTRELMEAADRLRAAGVTPSAATRERVAGLLAYLSENVGDVDGQHVAQLAVQIGRPDVPPGASGSPGQNGDPGSQAPGPADAPGLTDREPGPPDHIPANPPGQNKDKNEPGPPEGVPADPPGQDKDKNEPGPPDTNPSPPDNKP